MPIYVYTCPECELEEEQIHPVGQAPETLSCPLCGGYFYRNVLLFHVGGQAQIAPPASAPRMDAVWALDHGPDCLCCRPRPRRR